MDREPHKLGMAVNVFNANTWEVEATGTLPVQGQLALHKFQVNQGWIEPVSKYKLTTKPAPYHHAKQATNQPTKPKTGNYGELLLFSIFLQRWYR